ncbi:uncharacterized protein [Centruroides vittatus]|uniref:uncharacterized protein n=1 Tax=Centruroides vittatus TaxID=120091 RepID=UPI0035103FBC
MKTILFLVVLIGIATVDNSEASKKEIKEDVLLDAEKKGDLSVEEDSRQGGLTGVLQGIVNSLPTGSPGISDMTTSGLLKGLLDSLDTYNLTGCLIRQTGIDLQKCFNSLAVLNLNVSGATVVLNELLYGNSGRADQCSSCSENSLTTSTSSANSLCPTLSNITDNIACVLREFSKLYCLPYVDDAVRILLECLGNYVDNISTNGGNETACKIFENDLGVLLGDIENIVSGILGGKVSDPSALRFECLNALARQI